jgi:hypothetical protein
MLPINKMQMAQLPDSLVDVKEYCSRCGKVLGKGSTFVKATVEQIKADGESLLVDYDKRYFCKDCLRGGVYINVKEPNTANE